ncbi:MAG: hypothetical protein NTW50_04410 [Candidatus Berkelbacteria bacterium]|nr:hypothetical protein [Candidatus Berkelbacteria bacterium]
MLIVAKVGSSVLANGTGTRNLNQIHQISNQICTLWELGHKVILVTSGAVATGRTNRCLRSIHWECKDEIGFENIDPELLEKQVWAGAGQAELMSDYIREFRANGRECAQVLITRDDLSDLDASRGRNLLAILRIYLRTGVTPIVNENDVLTPEELEEKQFGVNSRPSGDNDHLAALVALSAGATKLILLTDVDGVYDGSPNDGGSQLIREILQPKDYYHFVNHESGTGQGGMMSKLYVADWVIPNGITVHIANGFTPNILIDIVDGREIGTVCRVPK